MPLADGAPEPCSCIRWHGLRRSDNEAVTENSAFLTERPQLQLVCTCRSCCEARDVQAMCDTDPGTGSPSPRRGLDRGGSDARTTGRVVWYGVYQMTPKSAARFASGEAERLLVVYLDVLL